jgi:acyl-[acyl carrier protein]--UDP-N-acetylglucosamine O-acyltransferase
MKPIIFLGSNPNILLYLDTANLMGCNVAGIIDSDYYGAVDNLDGVPIIGSEESTDFYSLKNNYSFFITINYMPGMTRNISKRQQFIKLINDYDLECVNLIEPGARIYPKVKIGQGIYIGHNAVISPHVVLDDFCSVYTHVGIGHHSKIGKNSVLQRRASISSNTILHDNCYIGLSSTVTTNKLGEFLEIGKNSVIGPGLTVMRSVADYEIVKAVDRTKKVYNSVIE